MNNFNTIGEVLEGNMKGAVTKATLPIWKMIMLGIFAGMFIAFGGEASNLAIHSISDVGVARTLAGAIFPVGLMLIVMVGGELFTGNCMMAMAVIDKRINIGQMIKNLVIVWLSNMVGSVFIAWMVNACGQMNYTNGLLGAFTIKVALGKCAMPFGQAFLSGILCNILVCIAILVASTARDTIGKLFGCFFPIWVFVISGFEHCVANMYYIPAGIIAAHNEKYAQAAMDAYGYTADQIASVNIMGMLHNLAPVTLGNIVGGAIIVGCMMYIMHAMKKKEK